MLPKHKRFLTFFLNLPAKTSTGYSQIYIQCLQSCNEGMRVPPGGRFAICEEGFRRIVVQ
jgi:hypothetical protein